jgi:hypothetical protein
VESKAANLTTLSNTNAAQPLSEKSASQVVEAKSLRAFTRTKTSSTDTQTKYSPAEMQPNTNNELPTISKAMLGEKRKLRKTLVWPRGGHLEKLLEASKRS